MEKWKNVPMAVVTAYLDASGSPATEVVAVGAVVATPDKWQEFHDRWNDCLDAFGISALHMKEFAHFRGEFHSWRDDEPKRKRLLNALLWIIQDCVDYTATTAVWMPDYDIVDANYALSETTRPYTMGAMGCAGSIVIWAKNSGHNKHDIIWIFEKGDEDQGDLRKHWDIVYPDARVEPIFCKKVDSYPASPARRIRAFEAADLIAYESRHLNTAIQRLGGSINENAVRRPLLRMRDLPGADLWGLMERPNIEQLCSQWNIPVRR